MSQRGVGNVRSGNRFAGYRRRRRRRLGCASGRARGRGLLCSDWLAWGGAIGRHFPVMHVSPSVENLLWLPDLVSHTYRRHITHDEDLVTRLDGQTVTLELPAH